MPQLYPVDKHCALRDEAWSEIKVSSGIREILEHSVGSFAPDGLWPRHPLDGDDPVRTGMYFGAGGVFWGVSFLGREGWIEEPAGWFDASLDELVRRNVEERRDLDMDSSRSYLFGDIPLLMLRFQHRPADELADELFVRLEQALQGPVQELMWGRAGCMLAVRHLHEATGQARWQSLYRSQAQRLVADARPVAGVGYHWLSVRRDRAHSGLGAVHGFAGNVVALLRGSSCLGDAERAFLLERVPETLLATVLRDAGRANWPHSTGSERPIRLYHCHGAPGIVTSLATFPVGVSPALDEALIAAGQLVIDAGALRKGPSLCHGTAGNGFALLKLYQRTGDTRWLEAARRFAMHALWQVERSRELFAQGRHSLWTGDIGVALFLNECLRGSARFPTIDVF